MPQHRLAHVVVVLASGCDSLCEMMFSFFFWQWDFDDTVDGGNGTAVLHNVWSAMRYVGVLCKPHEQQPCDIPGAPPRVHTCVHSARLCVHVAVFFTGRCRVVFLSRRAEDTSPIWLFLPAVQVATIALYGGCIMRGSRRLWISLVRVWILVPFVPRFDL